MMIPFLTPLSERLHPSSASTQTYRRARTNKRKCGTQPANQSLITDVFRSRPHPCTIYRLFTVLYDGLIGKLLGETAGRLRLVFDAIALQRGVYFFDEFDAIGSQRSGPNDVGEIRRVLNSFLQFLENDDGPSLIIAATNHPELLDKALFRRFDDVITYALPNAEVARGILQGRLSNYKLDHISWSTVLDSCMGLSQAEISRAADEAAKVAVLAQHAA
jgi:SpoVK/Ycf46/Vps4 family AAA+-type ATPase